MNPSRLLLIAVGLISLLAGAALYHLVQPGAEKPAAAVESLNAIPLQALDGAESVLADWRGNMLVVNLWAPWCAPCRREVPTLIEFQRDFEAQGVQILGIALDGEAAVRKFAAEYGINYPLFLAAHRSVMYNAALGNPSGSLPFTAILDRDLNIVFRHNGEVTANQLRQQLSALSTRSRG